VNHWRSKSIPPITLVIPLFGGWWIALHLYNSYEGLISYLPDVHASLLDRHDDCVLPIQSRGELDEAARIDGAGSMKTLFRVILPLSRPGLVAVGFYAFMISWNEFLFALTLTQTDNMRHGPGRVDSAHGPVQLSMEPNNGQ